MGIESCFFFGKNVVLKKYHIQFMLLQYTYYLHIRRIKRGFHRNIEEMSSHIFSKIGIFDSRRDTYLKIQTNQVSLTSI